LTLSASALTIIRDDYDEERATFAPRLSHAFDFDRDFVFSLGHRLEDVEIKHLESDAPQDARDAKGHTTIVAANTSAQYDKVLYEYLEGPYDGSNSELFYEYAGGALGGQVNFHKFETTNEFYYPLYTYQSGAETLHHVISLFSRFGWIDPTEGDDDVPIFERYFLGGPNNVRGFRFREMGPHDGHDPVGGTAMLYANLEYTFPLFQKILRGVAFFDYGNLASEMESFSFDESRYVIGGGLRINFPFLGQPLPIGLYLGKAIKSEDDDRERLFLFTIGTRF
jgi:outer membrane protein insertion porin family